MRIVETLHVRMASGNLDELVDLVGKATGPRAGLPSVSVYRHTKVQGDLLVEVVRSDPSGDAEASELAIGLASLLRTYGLVEHSVWVRAEPGEAGGASQRNREWNGAGGGS